MSDKQAMIKELLEMQRKFIAYEHENGVEMKDYFMPETGHPLDGYRKTFNDLAIKLVDVAHEEVGSHR